MKSPYRHYADFYISEAYIVRLGSGVFRIWQAGGHERVEREPITGVWGRSPQRGSGAEPLVRGSGG